MESKAVERTGRHRQDEAGEPAAILQSALALLTDYQHQVRLTGAFLKQLDAADLLMQSELRADFADGRNALVQGLLVVDEARLKQLPVATLQEWLASGELGLLYAHLLSLGTVKQLVQRMTPLGAAPQVEENNCEAAKA